MADDEPGERSAAYRPPLAFALLLGLLYPVLILILCIHVRVVVHDYWRTVAERRKGATRVTTRTKRLCDRMTLLLILLNVTWLVEAAMATFWGGLAALTGRWWSLGSRACDWYIVAMLQLYCGGFGFIFWFYHTRWRVIRGAEAESASWLVKIAHGLIVVFFACQLATGFLVRGEATADGRCHIRRSPVFFVVVTVSYVTMFAISSILLNLFLRPIHATLRRATEAGTPERPGDVRLRAIMRRNVVAVAVTCSTTVGLLLCVVGESFWARLTAYDLRGVAFTSALTPIDIYVNSAATLYSKDLPFVGSSLLFACARRAARALAATPRVSRRDRPGPRLRSYFRTPRASLRSWSVATTRSWASSLFASPRPAAAESRADSDFAPEMGHFPPTPAAAGGANPMRPLPGADRGSPR